MSKQNEEITPSFSGRLLIVSILFFTPSAILFYYSYFVQSNLFITSQISGYIVFIFFCIAYIGLVKLIKLVLAIIGVRLR